MFLGLLSERVLFFSLLNASVLQPRMTVPSTTCATPSPGFVVRNRHRRASTERRTQPRAKRSCVLHPESVNVEQDAAASHSFDRKNRRPGTGPQGHTWDNKGSNKSNFEARSSLSERSFALNCGVNGENSKTKQACQ